MNRSKSQIKAAKCTTQFNRTIARTGKWRGKKPDQYVKYTRKRTKEEKPTSRFDRAKGYTVLDGNGKDKYVQLVKGGRRLFKLAKLYKPKKVGEDLKLANKKTGKYVQLLKKKK